MKFSQNGVYIESYSKCPNCGGLMYENAPEDRAKQVKYDKKTYCSQRCVEWTIDREARRGVREG
jgi:N-methylhydantoinase B